MPLAGLHLLPSYPSLLLYLLPSQTPHIMLCSVIDGRQGTNTGSRAAKERQRCASHFILVLSSVQTEEGHYRALAGEKEGLISLSYYTQVNETESLIFSSYICFVSSLGHTVGLISVVFRLSCTTTKLQCWGSKP
ncbi:hypothetical protein KIL84_014217 [Mauremys mutica]|uniref:Uncharacterized protein n=1 Tax=Mauremys mutica TaxID=74926 RepID=A0A9D4B7H7_9SAUR|nr:hypothetical protein KIL84_014217 [Mauremys mutica]